MRITNSLLKQCLIGGAAGVLAACNLSGNVVSYAHCDWEYGWQHEMTCIDSDCNKGVNCGVEWVMYSCYDFGQTCDTLTCEDKSAEANPKTTKQCGWLDGECGCS
jgi:hypothetical protein